MATKRIDDATRPVLSALEAGYKVLVDKISGGTKIVDVDKFADAAHTHVEADITDLGDYLTTETDPVFTSWDKSTGISITESQISDLGTYSEVGHTHVLNDVTDAGTIASLDYWTGTQAAYDLLTPDSNTLYIIIG
jgi:hypothetical protein